MNKQYKISLKSQSLLPLEDCHLAFRKAQLPQSTLPTEYVEAAPHGGLSYLS